MPDKFPAADQLAVVSKLLRNGRGGLTEEAYLDTLRLLQLAVIDGAGAAAALLGAAGGGGASVAATLFWARTVAGAKVSANAAIPSPMTFFTPLPLLPESRSHQGALGPK